MSKRLLPVRRAALSLAIALYGTSLSALAQPALDAATTLDEVTVLGIPPSYGAPVTATATKTETPVQDVPQAVAIVTEELIDDQAMKGMADVVRYVPGVQMAQGEGHRDAPILRGSASTADFFVNGVRDDVQYFRDLYNIERVDVLKGPSGVIFGRGNSGGLINRITKQADGTGRRELTLTLGDRDNRRMTFDHDQSLGDAAAFRITGLYENSESYRAFNQVDRRAINPTATFDVSDRTAVAAGYEHFEDERVVDRGVPSLHGKPLRTGASTYFGKPDSSHATTRVDAVTTTVTHQLGNGARLVNQTRYADYAKFYQNLVPGAVNTTTNQVAISGYSNRTARDNLLNQTDLMFTVQTGPVEHHLLAGVELNRQVTDNHRRTAYFPNAGANATSVFVALPETIYQGPVKFRQSASDADNHSVATTAAVYLQDQLTISPNWQAIVGMRQDRFAVDLFNRRNGSTITRTDHLTSPRAGLIYKPAESVSLYASYSLAYVPRAGEQLASLTPTNRTLDPEQFANRELGAKWAISEHLLTTAAAYQLDRTNVAVTDPNHPGQLILTDGQRVRGLELSIAGHVTAAWQLIAGYAHQASQVRTPGNQNGNQLGQVPEHTFSLWNRYDISEKWGLGLGTIYSDPVFVATDNTVKLPGFVRFDAAIYCTLDPQVRLQVNVENLFDRRYYASAHSNNNILPGSPRAIRLGATFRF
ncbi:TonB-dependent receptor [Tahibacter amnicola]|uniref:TonB-dependent siderophore receptor n=1 Tax=Tahibacter amnicola TaxID=2976241 RepID=A0ABY6BD43_9GAMM|nr:TonB-dependent siderophore receptor [Tahibacter amnicola]UXI66250.1 TonB-dependent siderophore receptor [Tahibacter amnicola]